MGFFSKKENEAKEEDYVTVKSQEAHSEFVVKTFNLKSFVDANEVVDALREGGIIALVNISQLRNEDLTELKRAINHIKKTCGAVGGSIVGIDQGWIVATPAFVEIEKASRGSSSDVRTQRVYDDSNI